MWLIIIYSFTNLWCYLFENFSSCFESSTIICPFCFIFHILLIWRKIYIKTWCIFINFSNFFNFLYIIIFFLLTGFQLHMRVFKCPKDPWNIVHLFQTCWFPYFFFVWFGLCCSGMESSSLHIVGKDPTVEPCLSASVLRWDSFDAYHPAHYLVALWFPANKLIVFFFNVQYCAFFVLEFLSFCMSGFYTFSFIMAILLFISLSVVMLWSPFC